MSSKRNGAKSGTSAVVANSSPLVSNRKLLDDLRLKKQPREPNKDARLEKIEAIAYEKELKDVRIEVSSKTKVEDKEARTALFSVAISSADLDFINLMFEEGIFEDANFSLDSEGTTPLHKAAYSAQQEVMKILCDEKIGKADPNAKTSKGTTPLMMTKDVNVAKALVQDHKADPNLVNECDKTAIHLAAYAGNYELVKLLTENGCNVHHKDKTGRNALHMAAIVGSHAVCEYLLDFYSEDELSVTDENGVTPLQYASMKNFHDLIRLFEKKSRESAHK